MNEQAPNQACELSLYTWATVSSSSWEKRAWHSQRDCKETNDADKRLSQNEASLLSFVCGLCRPWRIFTFSKTPPPCATCASVAIISQSARSTAEARTEHACHLSMARRRRRKMSHHTWPSIFSTLAPLFIVSSLSRWL